MRAAIGVALPASRSAIRAASTAAIVGLAAALATRAGAQPIPLLPPLPSHIVPVATFGEIAPGSFHPGIDLPAGGEPYEIRAAADGEIVRVRVSGSGYGRALDLLLPDGREIVYAHLSRFERTIEDSCRVLRSRGRTNDLDWIPPAGTFPVARGSTVGWTGETEDGRAILHVEVRVGGTPRNPLRNGFTWPDRVPPRIESIRFVPLGPASRIDGRLEDEVVAADSYAGGSAGNGGTVLWGPVGIECEAHDDVQGIRRAPFLVRLEVDGVLHVENDVGTRAPAQGWNPDQPEPVNLQAPLQRLYRPAERDRGRLLCGTTIPPGPHRIRLIARDAAGNTDSVSAAIVVAPNPRVEEWMGRPVGHGDWDLAVRVSNLAGEDPEQIRLTVDQTEDGRRFPVHTLLGQIGDGWFMGTVSSINPAGRAGIRMVLETRSGIATRGPVVSLDPAGGCTDVSLDPPSVRSSPRWIEIRQKGTCIPASAPRMTLEIPGRAVACDLLETAGGDPKGAEGEWRFVAPPPSRGAAGSSPWCVLTLDGSSARWHLDGVVFANPSEDLLWMTPDAALTVEIPAATFYAPVWLVSRSTVRQEERIPRAEIGSSPGSAEQDEVLIARSDAEAIGPEDLELDAPFRIAIRPKRLPESSEEARRLGIYGRTRGGPWRSLGGLWTGSAVVAVVGRLEEWIVLEDRSEPWIYALDPGPDERRIGGVGQLSAQIREQGSGVTGGSLEVYMDGARVPAAWNPWSRRLTAAVPDTLQDGVHRWEVRARDAAGNAAQRGATFTVTRQR